MVRIHPGPPFHRRITRHHAPVDQSGDRRTDIAEAGGAEPPWRTISTSSRSSADQSGRLRTGGSWVQFLPGAPLFPGVAQQQRHSAQNGASAGANPAAGTIFAPVAQRRGSGLKPRSVSVRIRPGAHHLDARVAQWQRRRLQTSDSAGATPGSPIASRRYSPPPPRPWAPMEREPDKRAGIPC